MMDEAQTRKLKAAEKSALEAMELPNSKLVKKSKKRPNNKGRKSKKSTCHWQQKVAVWTVVSLLAAGLLALAFWVF